MSRPIAQTIILIAAMLVIPWVAANPPPYRILDADWVQAWGSIIAIAAGFGYVAWQRDNEVRDRKNRERATRDHFGGVLVTVARSMEERLAMFRVANARNGNLVRILGRDSLEVLADELMTVSPTECASSRFSMLARQAGLFTRAFTHSCEQTTAKDPAPVTATDIREMEMLRDGLTQAMQEMVLEASRLES